MVGILLGLPAIVQAEEFQDKERHYSLTLPEGWGVVPADAITKLNQIVAQRLPNQLPYKTGFQLKDRPPLDYPHVLVAWETGNNSGTYDDIERILRQQEGKIRGDIKKTQGAFSEQLKSLSAGEIILDRHRNRVVLRFEQDVAGIGKVQGITVGFLGKDGSLWLHCYDRDSSASATLPTFEKILDSFRYEPGYAFQPGSSAWRSPAVLGAAAGGIIAVIAAAPLLLWRWWQKMGRQS